MRIEVEIFARVMSQKMDQRNPRRGEKWKSYTEGEWLQQFVHELEEFSESFHIHELVDVANFCMIGWHLFHKKGSLSKEANNVLSKPGANKNNL